jgi:hypothetical protein
MTEDHDPFFHFLVESLNCLDFEIGHVHHPSPIESLNEFNPEIIIHNIKNASKIEYRDVITISINDLDEDNCFSLAKEDSKNFIKPFIKNMKFDLFDEKYKTDVVYVGDPNLLPDASARISQNENINMKMLNNTPTPTVNYVGTCSFDNYKKFFHMSKCTLLGRKDSNTDIFSFKLLDILASSGNPIVFKNDEQFVKDAEDAVFNGTSFRDNFLSREEIFDKHTNHDRMSTIFSKIGLNKIAKMLLDRKGK